MSRRMRHQGRHMDAALIHEINLTKRQQQRFAAHAPSYAACQARVLKLSARLSERGYVPRRIISRDGSLEMTS